jgi:hypothetical protein
MYSYTSHTVVLDCYPVFIDIIYLVFAYLCSRPDPEINFYNTLLKRLSHEMDFAFDDKYG